MSQNRELLLSALAARRLPVAPVDLRHELRDQVRDATVYQLLRRCHRAGLVECPAPAVYRVTSAGKAWLRSRRAC